MKVFLPSHGIFGQKVVNMKVPTFKELHFMQSYNQDELLRKYKFVELLTDVDFSKVTAMDVEYLFTVAAFALVFNAAKYEIRCPNEECHEKITKVVKLTEQDIVELKIRKKDLPFHRRIKGKKYSYTLLTAYQMMEAYEAAQFEEDTEQAFQDMQVALIMGKRTTDIKYVRSLPISIYAAALLFQRMNYHGLETTCTCVCPKCHKVTKFNFTMSTKVLVYDVETLMDKFASVSDVLTFRDFMAMSLLDFNAFVGSLNKMIK